MIILILLLLFFVVIVVDDLCYDRIVFSTAILFPVPADVELKTHDYSVLVDISSRIYGCKRNHDLEFARKMYTYAVLSLLI
jgi:hypothetical protein